MTSLTVTFNALVQRLAEDRLRMRELASDVIRTGDEERSRAALSLHESAAQSIASVAWQLSALARDVMDPELSQRILFVKRQADDVLEDVRHCAERLHPRVLDDLGLAAALAQLARQAELECSVQVIANVDRELSKMIDASTAAAVYRMAQEATWNAVRHSSARTVRIRLFQRDTAIALEVVDDGDGFDVHLAERSHRRGHGIFAMRDRLGLVDVEMQVESTLGAGTKVCAYIPKRTEEAEMSA
jgi:signal transduction histidine kinase